MKSYIPLFLGSLLAFAPAYADEKHWITGTLDNDLFVGNDSGYTNGLYLSYFKAHSADQSPLQPDIFVKPLLWMLPDTKPTATVNVYSYGQTMATPSDITIEEPPLDEVPYSAALMLTNTFVEVHGSRADSVRTAFGFVGPIAGGETAQKVVHKIIGSPEPKGWHTQLGNEFIFQFSRGSIWRNWSSSNDHMDILTFAEGSLGTLESSVIGGAYFRYGRNLAPSFMIPLLNRSRATNPGSIANGWNIFAGLDAGYTFNLIYLDGNTFKNSRSIDYKHEQLGYTFGFAYSWSHMGISFAVSDLSVLTNERTKDSMKNMTQFGTLTLAFQL
ncbi:MAG: lipid A deacylase LpxR family protein [Pseudomonadota bacterium]|nr:hypothetical protein [Gammaproteobacteria bacterium]MEC8012355.1 lipid A deacylase LpxR family protein [Pseudomonadota bacterium]HBF06639.1 DUF2219 domain-containing protein [Gammaproteobacteria bacterium]|tara:strand:+ start:1100 stop:2086 length:987 start_codon:yes stop_codon:yes gene_type:complete